MVDRPVRQSGLTRFGLVLGAGLLIGGCTSGTIAPSVTGPATPAPSPVAIAPSPTAATATPGASPSASIGARPSTVLTSTTELTTVQPAGSILLEMTGPPPHFAPSKLSASAEDVVFFLKNTSPARDEHAKHDLAIGPDRDHLLAVSDLLDGGRSAVFTVHGLTTGTYVIWCTFPGHAGLGQTGTLTVTP